MNRYYQRYKKQDGSASMPDNNNNNNDEYENNDDDPSSDRLSLLPQSPPPRTKYMSPAEVERSLQQQKKQHHETKSCTSSSGSTAPAAKPIIGTSISTKQRRRKYIRRNYYDYDLLQSNFDHDPNPDSLDSILRPLWLGLGLFLVLLSFWILDVLKDPVLGALVQGDLEKQLPTAKLFSVCFTTILVIALEYVSAEQRKEKQRTLKQNRQQEETNRNSNKNSSRISTNNTETSVMDVLNGNRWSQMETTSSIDYDTDKQVATEEDDEEDHNQRVPSSIFATIGVPYCIAFAIMAYILQFNSSMEWKSSSTSLTKHYSPNTFNEDDPTVILELIKSGTNKSQANYKSYWYVLGYFWYAGIESFGSIQVATFWSYTNSTLSLHEAERCYGWIISMAQLGAILGTTMVTTHVWSNITLIITASLTILLHVLVMITYSKRFSPEQTTQSATTESNNKRKEQRRMEYRNRQELKRKARIKSLFGEKQQQRQQLDATSTTSSDNAFDVRAMDTTLWSGIYLILKHNYVLFILGVSCLYEVSLTILNYQMTLLGWNRYEIEEKNEHNIHMTFTQFMGRYGQIVNGSSLLMSSILFPMFIKHLGLRRTLWIFPTLLLIANVLAFGAIPGNLTVLFIAMALLKAMTYSVHDPSKEILYIPTSNSIKFKSKFWIDVVGARLAKAVGSGINAHSGSVDRSIRIASIPSIVTALALSYACYKVGTQFEDLVATGHIVGIDDDDGATNHEQNNVLYSVKEDDTNHHNNPKHPVVNDTLYEDEEEVSDDDDSRNSDNNTEVIPIEIVGNSPQSIELTAV